MSPTTSEAYATEVVMTMPCIGNATSTTAQQIDADITAAIEAVLIHLLGAQFADSDVVSIVIDVLTDGECQYEITTEVESADEDDADLLIAYVQTELTVDFATELEAEVPELDSGEIEVELVAVTMTQRETSMVS